MSSTFDQTTPRFFRPSDATRVRRNQRRIQLQRLAAGLRNALFMAAVLAGAIWIYRQTRSDARFAVRHVEIAGAVHTQRAAVENLTRRYIGANLFRIDIAAVQRDLRSLAWVERIAIEKKLPDTLRVNVIERVPVALVQSGSTLQYVDAKGVVLDRLSPSIGDADLPIVEAPRGAELDRTVAFLQSVRGSDPALYSRIAQVRAVAPFGFEVYDRHLGTTVMVNGADASAQWRQLDAIVRAERFARNDIEYADLRFAGRIVVKPLHPPVALTAAPQPQLPVVHVTN